MSDKTIKSSEAKPCSAFKKANKSSYSISRCNGHPFALRSSRPPVPFPPPFPFPVPFPVPPNPLSPPHLPLPPPVSIVNINSTIIVKTPNGGSICYRVLPNGTMSRLLFPPCVTKPTQPRKK